MRDLDGPHPDDDSPALSVGIYLPDHVLRQVADVSAMHMLTPARFDPTGFLALGWWEHCHSVLQNPCSTAGR